MHFVLQHVLARAERVFWGRRIWAPHMAKLEVELARHKPQVFYRADASSRREEQPAMSARCNERHDEELIAMRAKSVCGERVRGACAGSMCVERARGLRSVQRVRRTAKRGREHGLHYTVSICDTVPPPSTRQSAPRPSRSQIGALRARSRWIDEWKIDLAYACRQSANDSERDDNIFEAVGRWQHILRVELARTV